MKTVQKTHQLNQLLVGTHCFTSTLSWLERKDHAQQAIGLTVSERDICVFVQAENLRSVVELKAANILAIRFERTLWRSIVFTARGKAIGVIIDDSLGRVRIS